MVVPLPPDLSKLTSSEKDALILAQAAQLQAALARIAALETQLERLLSPPKTPDNSSLPPSKGQKPNHPDKPGRKAPRQGSLGRKGGGRALAAHPDEVVVTKPARCQCCHTAFGDEDHTLDARYDKIELPQVCPVVTRVERYSGTCRDCGAVTLAAVPEGLEPGTPFSLNIMALAIYLRITHAISYKGSRHRTGRKARFVAQTMNTTWEVFAPTADQPADWNTSIGAIFVSRSRG